MGDGSSLIFDYTFLFAATGSAAVVVDFIFVEFIYVFFLGTMFGGMLVGLGMLGTVSFSNTTAQSSDPRVQSLLAQNAGGGGFVPATPTQAGGSAPAISSRRVSMDPRLLGRFMGAGIPEAIMDKLSDAGVKTLSLFAALGGDENGFRAFLERPGMDVKATDLKTSIEPATIVAAWRTANTMSHVEGKAQAKRSLSNLPPEVSLEEVDQHARVFAASGGGVELTPVTMPSTVRDESRRSPKDLPCRTMDVGHKLGPGGGACGQRYELVGPAFMGFLVQQLPASEEVLRCRHAPLLGGTTDENKTMGARLGLSKTKVSPEATASDRQHRPI